MKLLVRLSAFLLVALAAAPTALAARGLKPEGQWSSLHVKAAGTPPGVLLDGREWRSMELPLRPKGGKVELETPVGRVTLDYTRSGSALKVTVRGEGLTLRLRGSARALPQALHFEANHAQKLEFSAPGKDPWIVALSLEPPLIQPPSNR